MEFNNFEPKLPPITNIIGLSSLNEHKLFPSFLSPWNKFSLIGIPVNTLFDLGKYLIVSGKE